MAAQDPEIDILFDKLITNRSDVLFVGEGDFTFTLAFAVVRDRYAPIEQKVAALDVESKEKRRARNVWNGITSTRYEPEHEPTPKSRPKPKRVPFFEEVQLKCIESAAAYSRSQIKMDGDSEWCFANCFKRVELIKDCPPPPKGSWKYGIDATAINSSLLQPHGVVWFQCPWPDDKTSDPSELIQKFLLNLVSNIESGSFVCVGITSHKNYYSKYNIDSILDKTAKKYTYLGKDSKLVKKVLRYGYHHKSAKGDFGDIHAMLLDYHMTLVFKKTEEMKLKHDRH